MLYTYYIDSLRRYHITKSTTNSYLLVDPNVTYGAPLSRQELPNNNMTYYNISCAAECVWTIMWVFLMKDFIQIERGWNEISETFKFELHR